MDMADDILRERMSAVPRLLRRLFEVAHTFMLSLRLEMLLSQAQALMLGITFYVLHGPSLFVLGALFVRHT